LLANSGVRLKFARRRLGSARESYDDPNIEKDLGTFDSYCDATSCTPPKPVMDCKGTTICNAAAGYDGPSGIGTPIWLGASARAWRRIRRITTGFRRRTAAGRAKGGCYV
jgi:hypothetical protein